MAAPQRLAYKGHGSTPLTWLLWRTSYATARTTSPTLSGSGSLTAQQDDIIAELGDDLRAEIGDRESDLDRPLTETELSAILKRRGEPVVVAHRFVSYRTL